jgi:hypothetical protein
MKDRSAEPWLADIVEAIGHIRADDEESGAAETGRRVRPSPGNDDSSR